jgi:hypothetical protein
MIRPTLGSLCGALLAAGASAASAQQQLPPVRPLGPVEHVSSELLGSVSSVRALSDGRVLVNDITARRVVLFDSTLASFTVVADSTSATATAYSSRLGGLIAYRGDSTLFVDPSSLSMLVIDPAGKIARVMSAPRPSDVNFLIGGPFGSPGFDPRGRLVYRGGGGMRMVAPPRPGERPGAFTMPEPPDSVPLVRVDLATRALDTAAFFKIPKTQVSMNRDDNGRVTISTVVNPLPVVDDWVLLADGTIAVIRGRDYHVDWVSTDGSVTASPKIPFEWERLTDEDKVVFVDSAKAAMEKSRAEMSARMAGGAGPAPGGAGTAAPGERIVMTMRMEGGAPAAGGGGGPAGAGMPLPEVNMISPSDLPDYRPPFSPGAARADADGNVWIRTSKVVDGSAVYDVIDRKGELVDRVKLPPFRVIAGFGPGGIVYMGVRDGTGTRLERARVR